MVFSVEGNAGCAGKGSNPLRFLVKTSKFLVTTHPHILANACSPLALIPR